MMEMEMIERHMGILQKQLSEIEADIQECRVNMWRSHNRQTVATEVEEQCIRRNLAISLKALQVAYRILEPANEKLADLYGHLEAGVNETDWPDFT